MSSHNPIISVIIPCYNEEEVLLHCHSRLMQVFEGTPADEYELIYVNDGSSDRTEEILRLIHRSFPQVGVVMLSRNFGHQAAVTAGLTAAKGDCVVIIDSRLAGSTGSHLANGGAVARGLRGRLRRSRDTRGRERVQVVERAGLLPLDQQALRCGDSSG